MDDLAITRRSVLKMLSAAAAAAPFLHWAEPTTAAELRVLAAGSLPDDSRLGALKDLNGYFPWTPSDSLEAWAKRADFVRRQIQVACGLWPMPARPTIQATVHGGVEREGYTVEKVFFESHDGLYVTGSLYRPTGQVPEGRRPGVLCPHGHWPDGRFFSHADSPLADQLKQGAEKFEVGGRYPLQARCVQLARMGCVVFLYDMLGYADNQTLSQQLVHGFAKQRPDMSQPDRWGLFSAQSELRLLNVLGLQTWNSIRALDWLTSLPDVDANRIGVTGASGGGTQTFILGALDPRPLVLFPAVMVSTAMQGGCTCENASLLRIGTGNIEFAAMLAPRRVGLSAANDWTRELETKGLPELKRHYEMLGAATNISGKHLPFAHNYNHPSRAMMYAVFAEAFGLQNVSLEEQDFKPLTKEEATVWSKADPAPTSGDEAELKIVRGFAREFDQQLHDLSPTNSVTFEKYQQVIGGGWQALIGRDLSMVGEVTSEHVAEETVGNLELIRGLARNATHQEELPFVAVIPEEWNRQLIFWLTETGKVGLFDADGQPLPDIQKLVKTGYVVAGADLLSQGEFLTDGQPLTETRKVENPREFLGFTTGYNHPLVAQRTHDVLSLIAAAMAIEEPPDAVHLVGIGQAAVYAAAAAVQPGVRIGRLIVAPQGFRFGRITEIRDPMLLPGAVRYGDIPGLLALRAPHALTVIGETGDALPLTTAAYQATGAGAEFILAKSLTDAVAPLL